METRNKNKLLRIIVEALIGIANLAASGSLMQTFLATLGFESSLIYIHSTLFNVSNVITILLCSRWADKGNIINRTALIYIPKGILFLLYLPICISKSASVESYILLLLVAITQSITIGLETICSYKIPYFLFTGDDYNFVLGISGVVSSVVSLITGALISALTRIFVYSDIMLIVFLLSSFLMIVSYILTKFHKSIIDIQDADNTSTINHDKIPIRDVFMHPTFFKLLPAHLSRGFTYGIIMVLATVAFDLGFSTYVLTAIISIQSATTLLSSALFVVISRRVPEKTSILISSILFLLLPFMIIKNDILFLLLYGIIYFMFNIINISVPAMLLRYVPLEIAGPYNALRMALHNGATTLATIFASFLPVPVLLITAAAFQIFSGISYFNFRINRK